MYILRMCEYSAVGGNGTAAGSLAVSSDEAAVKDRVKDSFSFSDTLASASSDGPTRRGGRNTNSFGISGEDTRDQKTRQSALDVKLDVDYVSRRTNFWFARGPALPDRLESSDPGDSRKEKRDEDVETGTISMYRPTDCDTYHDLVVPDPHEIIVAKDVVFISSAQDAVAKMMKSIMGESRGLFILKSNVMSLPGFGTELLECVVSESNPFVGMKVSEISQLFADRYKAGIITVRGKGYLDPQRRAEEGKEGEVNENGDVINASRTLSGQLINMRQTMQGISRALGISQDSAHSPRGSRMSSPTRSGMAMTGPKYSPTFGKNLSISICMYCIDLSYTYIDICMYIHLYIYHIFDVRRD
jgi:hypothetical protein